MPSIFRAARVGSIRTAPLVALVLLWGCNSDGLGTEGGPLDGAVVDRGVSFPDEGDPADLGGSCTNGVTDGDETDVDCGGARCNRCPDGGRCLVGGDCASQVCGAGQCVSSCTDGFHNGRETDVDCGGACPRCGLGAGCGKTTDCTSNGCVGGRCVTPLQPSLGPPVVVDTGAQFLDQLVAGDWNGDGKVDLASADTGGGAVVYALGTGDGRLRPPVTIPVGPLVAGIAVGDLDEDGRDDLVVLADKGPATVLLANGQGGFRAPTPWPSQVQPRAVAVGDIDGDGHLDVVVADYFSTSIATLRGNGRGALRKEVITQGVAEQVNRMAIADLDGDGHGDVAITQVPDLVLVWRGTASGALQSAFSMSNTMGATPALGAVTLADLNQDRRLDVVFYVVGFATGQVLLNQGKGKFQAGAPFPVCHYPQNATIADIDRDGVPDPVAGCDAEHLVSVTRGDGKGGVDPASPEVKLAGHVGGMAAGDFNGDGKSDLAAVTTFQFVLLLNTSK